MRYRHCIWPGIFLLFAVRLFAEERAAIKQPDPQEIIRRVAATYERDISRLSEHIFQQRSVTQEFDRNGSVRETKTRTYEAVILFGQRYLKLTAIDDKPLNEIDKKREDERLNKAFILLKERSDEDRKKAMETQVEGFMREIGDELPYILDYRIVDEEMIDGQPVWVVQATPMKNSRPKSRGAKLFSKFSGKVWVTKADYTWVKLEAELTDDFTVGWLLFRIYKGACIESESTFVDGVWLPKQQSFDMGMRALWNSRRARTETIYSRHQKFISDENHVAAREY